MKELINYISNYVQMTPEEVHDVTRDVIVSTYPKNSFLIRQGELTQKMLFILKGLARAYYVDNDGTEHTSEFIFENQPVIYIEAFTKNTPSSVNVIALENSEIIWVSRDNFFSFLQKFPRFEVVLREIIMHQMSLDMEHNRILRINSSKERYEALLKSRPDIIKRVPLKYIASYLEMAFGTLSRVLSGKL